MDNLGNEREEGRMVPGSVKNQLIVFEAGKARIEENRNWTKPWKWLTHGKGTLSIETSSNNHKGGEDDLVSTATTSNKKSGNNSHFSAEIHEGASLLERTFPMD